MKAKQVKLTLVSGGLSLLTAILSIIIAMVASSIYAYGFFIVVACFFISRHNPKSLWYGPILCNAMSIIALITRPNSRGIAIPIVFILSLIAAISGAKVGKRSISNAS